MNMKVFAVRDLKSAAFMQPFFTQSVGTATRIFGDAVEDEKSIFHKHPEDFVLYELGEFDDQTGHITSIEAVKMVVYASDFVANKAPLPAVIADNVKAFEYTHGGK